MYKRQILGEMTKTLTQLKSITLTGPRQSGKTTLIRHAFPDFVYLNLEDPELRKRVIEDPKGILKKYQNKNIIWDEIQRVPELTSYL